MGGEDREVEAEGVVEGKDPVLRARARTDSFDGDLPMEDAPPPSVAPAVHPLPSSEAAPPSQALSTTVVLTISHVGGVLPLVSESSNETETPTPKAVGGEVGGRDV